MGRFKYTATNMSGIKIDGIYDASDKSGVIDMLKGKSYYPLNIELIRERNKTLDIDLSPKLPMKEVTIYCNQMATVLRAGVPMAQALSLMLEQSESKKLRKILTEVMKSVEMGETLSDAFSEFPKAFPALFYSLIKVGEMSGNLEKCFDEMGESFQKSYRLSQKVRSAMIYPSMIAIVCLLVVWYLLTGVVPTFVDMFDSMGQELPFVTTSLIALSNFVVNNGLLIVVVTAVVAFAFKLYISSSKGKLVWGKFQLRAPAIGKQVVKIIAARYTRTLCTLISAGVSLTASLEITATAVINPYVEKGLEDVSNLVKQGQGLYGPLEKLEVFPPMVIQMTRLGEESGTLEEMMLQTAEFFDEEAQAAITKLTAMMEPLIILMLGGIVLYVVLAILIPVFSSYSMV